MREFDLAKRTKQFALQIIALTEMLPTDMICGVLTQQLVRSATSVGANYRAAKRARSNAEYISKMGIVEEEADECGYWLELLEDSGRIATKSVALLRQEASELVAIAIASIHTARGHISSAKQIRNESVSS